MNEYIKEPKKVNILLLTHRDSDNLGDQFIEACDISIISAVMKNLGYDTEEYEINSQKAALVTPKYINTRESKLLKQIKKEMNKADVIIVGGAPQFNYLYQYFSERTVVIVKLAEQFGKPIIFSAIGIEHYDPEHPKCQRLKKVINYNCVKMVTTRDNLADLKRIKERDDLFIDRVADPAVFSGYVFKNFHSKAPNKKKIGIFIIRAGAFDDNKIKFTTEDAAELWTGLIQEIEKRGYDYELLTSGHYSDEAFIDHLTRNCGVKLSKCVFNMYKPEQLIEKISSYAGIISCRLHPSILAYSLKVPSVGIVWNPKVIGFYDAINMPERTIEVENISPSLVMDKLEMALSEGVVHNESFITSVYTTLFSTLKEVLNKNDTTAPYSFSKIIDALPLYPGTSEKEAEEKLQRKTRRCYNNYNNRDFELKKLKDKYNLEKNPIPLRYFSSGGENLICCYQNVGGEETLFKNGGHEYTAPNMMFHNNGKDVLAKIQYIRKGYHFLGWTLRVRSYHTWFWLMKNDVLANKGNANEKEFNKNKALILDEGILPIIPLKYIDSIVLEARWEKK